MALDFCQDENNFAEDSDKELEVAFSKGLIKPGLNVVLPKFLKEKHHVNNLQGLKNKLSEIKSNLVWDERLDLECECAPLDPELAVQLEEYNQIPSNNEKTDLVTDDFRREMHFYRIAQAGVLESLPKLRRLGFPTKRPEDYFAEMAKSDDHMQKVRNQLKKKENVIMLKDKFRRMRELKKYGKQVQIEKQLERQKEKRQLMEQVKKFRKGRMSSLDFLDENVEAADSSGIMKSKKQQKRENERTKARRQMKNKKFGFGAEQLKRGWKRNVAGDLDGPLNSVGRKTGRTVMRNRNKNKKRPGKKVRQQMKSKKRR